MHAPLPKGSGVAISIGPGTGIDPVPEAGANPGNGIDDDWFYPVAIDVFGSKDTGNLIHLATGWPRTSCYAFVAREPSQRRKPSPEFLRILFRSNHGQPFHAAFMHGCEAQWWRDLQDERKIGSAALAAARDIRRV
jgi:hypothetical protein